MSQSTKFLPESERPYEKCLRFGAEFLTDAELLAVIIRIGTNGNSAVGLAREILQKKSGNLLALYELSLSELQTIPGIGSVKAIQLKCIAELSKRIAMTDRRCRIMLQDARSVAGYYMERLRHEQQEHLILSMFDTGCHLIQDVVLSIGTVNASLISPREIFVKALEHHAVQIILLHNHPSGVPFPSRQDIQVTKQIMEGGQLLGVTLADHIIIGDKQYYSFREQGML